MKKIIFFSLVLSSVIFFGCKNMGGGDPKAVLVEFMDALAKKDISTARKLATKESKSMLDLIEMGMQNDKSNNMEKYDKTKMEIGEAKIDGDKATVPVKEKDSNESTNFTLKKEDGSWKVAFDKTSMMQMGMDKMKEKGIDNPMDSMQKGMDEMNKGLDEFKKMNMDSLKDAMKQGMGAMDSLKKALDKNK